MNWKKGLRRLVSAIPIFGIGAFFVTIWQHAGVEAEHSKISSMAAAILSLSVIVVPYLGIVILIWIVLGFIEDLHE